MYKHILYVFNIINIQEEYQHWTGLGTGDGKMANLFLQCTLLNSCDAGAGEPSFNGKLNWWSPIISDRNRKRKRDRDTHPTCVPPDCLYTVSPYLRHCLWPLVVAIAGEDSHEILHLSWSTTLNVPTRWSHRLLADESYPFSFVAFIEYTLPEQQKKNAKLGHHRNANTGLNSTRIVVVYRTGHLLFRNFPLSTSLGLGLYLP